MKRYPLQTLIKLRDHRTQKAQLLVQERQREARRNREACLEIEDEIADLETERGQHRGRLLAPAPVGMPWATVLTQREAHIDWLQGQADAARQRLFKAQETLRAAELALEEAKQAFFRAKARQDALEKRRDVWQGEERSLEARREEAAAAELVQPRLGVGTTIH